MVTKQKNKYRANKLENYQIKQLESIKGWTWKSKRKSK